MIFVDSNTECIVTVMVSRVLRDMRNKMVKSCMLDIGIRSKLL